MSDKVIPVKVALRIRPLNPRERADGCSECLRTLGDVPQVILGKDKAFTYDYVFSQQTPQIEVYETAVQPLLNSLFKGYNTTVLAYGQTGSGKTHTMGSAASLSYDCDNTGVIPRVLNDLFQRIEDEKFIQKDTKFIVKVSFVEIYNEEIKDLLNARQTEPLNIREENNSIKVVNLSEVLVASATVTKELLERGSSLRVVGGTAMNEQSSRSHAIFTIALEQLNEVDNNLIKSKFHLVDLAGSERQSKTKAEGVRLKEGININLGLLALGNVISVLGEDCASNKTKHVPYRESKLTRLLQDSLGGNSHTLMIACVSPADSNMEETLNTLRYADRARKIKNKPIVNIDPQAAELTSLRQQVQEYKAHIFKLTGGTLPGTNANVPEISELRDELEKYKIENHKLASELQRLIHSNRNTYEKLSQMEMDKEAVENKFEEMKVLFESMKNELKQSTSINQETLADFENKFGEIKEISINKNVDAIASEQDLNDENTLVVDKDYALRQAQLQIQLSEYDTEIHKKQMLHQIMLESTSQYGGFNYQASVDELKLKVEALEKEKEELKEQMIQGENSNKMSQQRRERLKALEAEVLELKKKEREFSKMQKLKEENERNCEKLKQEIAHIKQERVKLMKQMKAETQAFRQYKQQKEKEVNQLKALERKRQVEISKLQVDNNKQEAMLKRKNDEIARTHKQLKELMEKKRQVAEKRQMQNDRKDSSAEIERLRQWVTQEVEMHASIAEARASLVKLVDERSQLNAEIAELEDKLANEDEPPQKLNKKTADLDSTYVTNGTCTSMPMVDDDYAYRRQCLINKLESLKYDKECKTALIDDLNQMVIESDQNEDKNKNLFAMVHGMSETKSLLRHLFNLCIQYLYDLRQKNTEIEILTTSAAHESKDLKDSLQLKQQECEKLKKHYANEIDNLTSHYEQRIIACLRTNFNDIHYTYDEKIRLMAEQLQFLESKFERKSEKAVAMALSGAGAFAIPQFNDVTNFDEQKKSLKLKREARRTRVIRTVKADALQGIDTIEESPKAQSYMSDDREADPDWVKTPIRVRRDTRNVKKMKQSLRNSKSSSELDKKENILPPTDEQS